jgi:hypothetical protein
MRAAQGILARFFRCNNARTVPELPSNLIAVAYGRNAKDAAPDGQVIPAKKQDELAAK